MFSELPYVQFFDSGLNKSLFSFKCEFLLPIIVE